MSTLAQAGLKPLATQIDGHVTSDDVMEELLRGDALSGANQLDNQSTAAAQTPLDENPTLATDATVNGGATRTEPSKETSTTVAEAPLNGGNTNSSQQPEQSTAGATIGAPNAGSLFDQHALQTSGTNTVATGDTGAVALKDTDLVEFQGKIVPWSQVKAGSYLKHEYDKELGKLAPIRQQNEADRAAILAAKPQVDALTNDPAGRVYADTLLTTRDPQKALAAAAAVNGIVLPEAAPPPPDPRLIPPTDERGDALETHDPRYIDWATNTRAAAIGEAAANARWNELQAEQNRIAAAEQAARTAAAQRETQQQSAVTELRNHNEASFRSIGAHIVSRGIDPNSLTPEQKSRILNGIAETGLAAGKNIRSDEWLASNRLDPGDIALMLDASGVIDKIKSEVAGTNGSAGSGQRVGANGMPLTAPEKIPDTLSSAEIEAAERVKAEQQGGKLKAYYNRQQPLNAGSNSEMIPGRSQGYQAPKSGADLLREADAELGI